MVLLFFFSSRRRHTRCSRDWSSDVCSSDLLQRIYQSLFRILLKLLDRFRYLLKLSCLTIPAVCMPAANAFNSQFNIVVIPFFYQLMAYLTRHIKESFKGPKNLDFLQHFIQM